MLWIVVFLAAGFLATALRGAAFLAGCFGVTGFAVTVLTVTDFTGVVFAAGDAGAACVAIVFAIAINIFFYKR